MPPKEREKYKHIEFAKQYKELQKSVEEFDMQFEETQPAFKPQNVSLTLELSKKGQRRLKRILNKNEKKIRKATRLINKSLKYLPKGTDISVNMEKCDLKTEIVTDKGMHIISSEFKIKRGDL